jgi:hypothetical protein
MGQGPDRRGLFNPPPKPPLEWWERKPVALDSKPLPALKVNIDPATPGTKSTVELDDRLRAIQTKLDQDVEEKRRKILYPNNRPPPGKIRVLETDADAKGQLWVTKFVNQFGNVETASIGKWKCAVKRK